MASGIINTINSILTKLGAITYSWAADSGKQFPDKLFQFVAMYNNQIERAEAGDGFLFGMPAAFVSLENTAPMNLIGNMSQSDYLFRIRIVDMQLSSMNGQLDQNLDIFVYRNEVKRQMINFTPDNCTRLMWVDESTDENHNDVYQYILTFKGNVLDQTGTIDDADRTDIIWTEPNTITSDLTVEIDKTL